jgi:hypothetical protein
VDGKCVAGQGFPVGEVGIINRHRCQATPAMAASMAFIKARSWSEITSCTPPRPRTRSGASRSSCERNAPTVGGAYQDGILKPGEVEFVQHHRALSP